MRLVKPSKKRSSWTSPSSDGQSGGLSVNYLCLLDALESGWQIREVADVPGHGSDGLNTHLLVRLTHPTRGLESEITLQRSRHAVALLRQHRVSVA
jgi:hypothetical protein